MKSNPKPISSPMKLPSYCIASIKLNYLPSDLRRPSKIRGFKASEFEKGAQIRLDSAWAIARFRPPFGLCAPRLSRRLCENT